MRVKAKRKPQRADGTFAGRAPKLAGVVAPKAAKRAWPHLRDELAPLLEKADKDDSLELLAENVRALSDNIEGGPGIILRLAQFYKFLADHRATPHNSRHAERFLRKCQYAVARCINGVEPTRAPRGRSMKTTLETAHDFAVAQSVDETTRDEDRAHYGRRVRVGNRTVVRQDDSADRQRHRKKNPRTAVKASRRSNAKRRSKPKT